VWLEVLRKLKKLIHLVGSRTRDLPVRITNLPRAPDYDAVALISSPLRFSFDLPNGLS
jgi:hypothetical protein